MPKIKTREEIQKIVEKLKKEGKKIVTTNGVFDILHVAHLRFLKKAKQLGDVLIVLVNSDSSVKKVKGDKRPIVPENERAEAISLLDNVDYVTIFNEESPFETLKLLKPHTHTKGGSIPDNPLYKKLYKEEKELVKSLGGKHVQLDFEEGYSTTNIIEKILERHKE